MMNDFETLTPARHQARLRMLRRRRVTIGVALAVLLVLVICIAWACSAGAKQPEAGQQPSSSKSQSTESPVVDENDPASAADTTPQLNLDSPDSLTVVVNKQRPVTPLEWQPSDLVVPEGIPNNWGDSLRSPAASALQEMYLAAEAVGVPFTITSGYRDAERQAALFDGYVASDGVEAADTYSARPGYSEHQTGLAVDLTDGGECSLEECFGETEMGLWLREHAWQFGFILRYEQGEQAVVGYSYEPWHFRYVGKQVASEMHEKGIVNLEDFVGLPAAPGYN